MTRVVSRAIVGEAVLAGVLAPRAGVVAERSDGAGVFRATEGPVRDYLREVTVDHLPDGRSNVTQTVNYRLTIPFFGLLFRVAYRRELGRIGAVRRTRWWSGPDPLSGEAVHVLACLAALAIVTGYLSTLITQTITFSAQEFHAGRPAQGVALAFIRTDVVFSVALVALADRRGRRMVAIWSAIMGSLFTAIGALTPSLAWLAASQILARGFVTAVSITVAVMAAEAMPAGSRAYALSITAVASALGTGLCVLALPFAGLWPQAWRGLFAAGIIGVPFSLLIGRRLPESRRYEASHRRAGAGGVGTGEAGAGGAGLGGDRGGDAASRASSQVAGSAQSLGDQPSARSGSQTLRAQRRGRAAPATFRRRLLLLAAAAFLFNLFVTPASQFQNEFLRKEHHFSAARITLFTVVTVVPGVLGIAFGGRLADVRGRRLVGTVATTCATAAVVGLYFSVGWPMWAFSTAAAVVGTAVIPALGVYGPELFGTARRGTANGVITVANRLGGILGLVAVGFLAGRLGRFGPAFAIVAVGPLMLAALIVIAFPETARRELEDLNPEDRSPEQVAQSEA